MTGRLEPRSGWVADRCSIAGALDVVSARSAFLLLREAFYGTTRFDDFAERTGLSQAVTADRLRELVDEGLLEREAYREPGQRTRHEYRLTPKGRELTPVIITLMQWGDRHLAGPDGPPRTAYHDGCGGHVVAQLVCEDCGRALPVDEVESRPTRPELSTAAN